MSLSSNSNNYLKIIKCYDTYINSIQSPSAFVCVELSINYTNLPNVFTVILCNISWKIGILFVFVENVVMIQQIKLVIGVKIEGRVWI